MCVCVVVLAKELKSSFPVCFPRSIVSQVKRFDRCEADLATRLQVRDVMRTKHRSKRLTCETSSKNYAELVLAARLQVRDVMRTNY
jgi:hypothetical protein